VNPYDWLKLPLLDKIVTLLVAVFFGQRFDAIGRNPTVAGYVLCGPAKGPYVLHGSAGCTCAIEEGQ
jgi:hypothetical protein